jgi:hypothetical protein
MEVSLSMRFTQFQFIAVGSVLLLAGCSSGSDQWKSKRPKTAPAAGVITLNGKPLDGAQVILVPTSGDHGGSALSEGDGRFRLATFPPDDGVVPGNYKVMIIKSLVPQNPDPGSPESTVPQFAKLLVPEKYTDAESSGLTVEIPASGKQDIRLELKE